MNYTASHTNKESFGEQILRPPAADLIENLGDLNICGQNRSPHSTAGTSMLPHHWISVFLLLHHPLQCVFLPTCPYPYPQLHCFFLSCGTLEGG